MLSSLKLGIRNMQLQQVRLGHKMRGKPPTYARTLKDRIDELNYKDDLYTTRIDIGFPRATRSSTEVRNERMAHIKKIKSDKDLELQARNKTLQIDLKEAHKDWLKTQGPGHKKNIAEHYGVFEHLYGEGYFYPIVNLEINYDIQDGLSLPVCTGNVIKPSESTAAPSVTYESGGNDLWTLVLTNPDGHLTENDKEYVHWMVANIPGNNIEKGDILVDYLQPFPLKGTGYHRYVFILYKQSGKVSYDEITKVTSATLDNRTFTTRDWYQKHQDVITPAGLAFFQCDWDQSVKDFFHNKLNMKEPIYEYDFAEPYVRPEKWFPRRKPFNIYLDRYRDPKDVNKDYLLRKMKSVDPFKKPDPPLRFPNAHPLPRSMPSWLKLHEKKLRLNLGRVNEI